LQQKQKKDGQTRLFFYIIIMVINVEYLNELLENMNFDENSYFFYVVEKGTSEDIFEQGIAMEDESLLNQNIILLEDMKDPLKFCKRQLKKRQKPLNCVI